jgi:hypothetical protein
LIGVVAGLDAAADTDEFGSAQPAEASPLRAESSRGLGRPDRISVQVGGFVEGELAEAAELKVKSTIELRFERR